MDIFNGQYSTSLQLILSQSRGIRFPRNVILPIGVSCSILEPEAPTENEYFSVIGGAEIERRASDQF